MGRRALWRDAIWFGTIVAVTGQWIIAHAMNLPLEPPWTVLLPGLGIFGAAFLLSWGAELAELELSQSLALAFLALMAVLPEYAVDMYLAWTAAKDPSYIQYAAANMTGANRILIGFGWPVLLLCYWLKSRQRSIQLHAEQRVELRALVLATLYAFTIPLKGTFSLLDTVVLVGLFIAYLIHSSKAEHVTPEFHGPPARIAVFPKTLRRLATLALFLLPGYTIFIAAEPFADGLLHSARHLGIEEFVLIQWLAPLASESPEFIVAILFALRSKPGEGFGALVSSKVNQWTLLIGMLPLVYAISGGRLVPMPLDARQTEEVLLTVAQSLLAVVMLANWRFGVWEAVLLLSLFGSQLALTAPRIRMAYAVAYLCISAAYLMHPAYRRSFINLLTMGWRGRQGRSNGLEQGHART